MSREAMQQALDAIEGSGCKVDLMAAADALRAALAEQSQPRPRTAKMDALMAKVQANPCYGVENVAASMSAAMTTCPHGVPHRWPCDECDA